VDTEQLFKGLADRTRLRILNLLGQGELCVCDLQFVLKAPQANVSRHLTYLKNSGLVLDRREGARIYYRLNRPEDGIQPQLFAFLQAALRDDPAFAEDLRALKDAIQTGACSVSQWQPLSAWKHQPELEQL
jgi:ArsR family transcriptional regulator